MADKVMTDKPTRCGLQDAASPGAHQKTTRETAIEDTAEKITSR